MRIKRTSKIVINLVAALLLVLTGACAPIQEKVTTTPQEDTPPGEVTIPEEVTPPEEGTTQPTTKPTSAVEAGVIEIRVTDPPPADVKSVIVHLTNVEIHKAAAEQEKEQEKEQEQATGDNQTPEQEQATGDNQTPEQEQEQEQESRSEWISIIGAPPSFDLMDVIGIEQLLGSVNVTAGKYTQIRMDVDRVEVVTVDGDNYTAEVPSGKLKIVRPFTVEAGVKTVLTLDFDGEKSLIITGKGKALFKPVVKLLINIEKAKGQEEEEIEGEEEDEDKGKG
ncbi:DUF4382 domain-containing protein [Chloroflexota bacterium]